MSRSPEKLIYKNGKILFLHPRVPRTLEGQDIRTYYFIKNLVEMFNHEITLIISDYNKERKNYLKEIKNLCDVITISSQKGSLGPILNTISWTNIFSTEGDFFPLESYAGRKVVRERIKGELEKKSFDCVFTHYPLAGYVSSINLPKLVDAQDADSKKWRERIEMESDSFKKAYLYLLMIKRSYCEKNIYKKFDKVLVTTEKDRNALKSPSLNLEVITNGVNASRFETKFGEDRYPSLIYTGKMSTKRNEETVLFFTKKILPKVLKKYPDLKFYIVGSNPSEKVKELGEREYIEVTGFVEDISEYLARGSVFICPQFWGWGIKNKVLEAMAAQRPVVTTSRGANGIKCKDGKDVFVADEPEKFADKIIHLLRNASLRKKMGKKARETVIRNHSWTDITENLNILLAEMSRKESEYQ